MSSGYPFYFDWYWIEFIFFLFSGTNGEQPEQDISFIKIVLFTFVWKHAINLLLTQWLNWILYCTNFFVNMYKEHIFLWWFKIPITFGSVQQSFNSPCTHVKWTVLTNCCQNVNNATMKDAPIIKRENCRPWIVILSWGIQTFPPLVSAGGHFWLYFSFTHLSHSRQT